MKTGLLPLFFCLLLSLAAFSQERYEYRDGDPNGTNKWYMGRQIAHVITHQGIEWLERPQREKNENSSQLIKNLDIKPNMVVADIGAGSGYHTSRISKLLTNGKVYAVDIGPEMIKYIDQRIIKEKLNNVTTVLNTEQSIGLPANSIDLMFLVDVYHEFSYPYEMARSMLDALKPGSLLYIIEFRAEDSSVPIRAIHKMSEAQVRIELTAAGFKFIKNIPNLPWQHCIVFKKPE